MTTLSKFVSILALTAAFAMPAQAGDTTQQTFVFIADLATDNPGLDPAVAERLARKILENARDKGFHYGDEVRLMTSPGGPASWDMRFMVLKSQKTHPQQLAAFLTRKMGELSNSPLSEDSQIMWALESASPSLDCAEKNKTFVYAITNGASAGRETSQGFGGNGTSPGALQGCHLVWVGLATDTDGLSGKARRGLIPFFQTVSQYTGATHDIVQ